jgi:hypothetical protein
MTTTCPTPLYRFWENDPGSRWSMVQDYSVASTFKWVANGAPGVTGIEVDVRDASRPVAYDAVTNVSYTLTACSGATLTTDIASPQVPGTQVTLTGGATCPRTADFRFWIRAPGGAWSVVRDYGSATTFVWHTPTLGGSYGLEVDVRDHGTVAAYETTTNIAYGVTAPCSVPSLSPNLGSPQAVATTVTFTGGTTGCPSPQYRFWVRPPGGSYVVQQDYGASATFTWSTAGLAVGTYAFEVDVRNQGSAVAYDSARGAFFALTSPACTAATLKASTGPPGGTGVPATLTGAASNCPAPQFRFWVRAPGGSWTIARDYATSPTYAWPGGAAAGTYSLEVDVRALGSSVTYEVVANMTYAVTGCSAAALSVAPTSPQAHGTQVVLTGSATCLGTPEYRFWVRAPGGSWTIAQDYSPISTFAWTPATAGTYQVEVDVRDQGAGATYETVANISFVAT